MITQEPLESLEPIELKQAVVFIAHVKFNHGDAAYATIIPPGLASKYLDLREILWSKEKDNLGYPLSFVDKRLNLTFIRLDTTDNVRETFGLY